MIARYSETAAMHAGTPATPLTPELRKPLIFWEHQSAALTRHPASGACGTLFAFAVAVVLPYSPLAHWLGFVPVPATIMGALALVTIAYLFSTGSGTGLPGTRH